MKNEQVDLWKKLDTEKDLVDELKHLAKLLKDRVGGMQLFEMNHWFSAALVEVVQQTQGQNNGCIDVEVAEIALGAREELRDALRGEMHAGKAKLADLTRRKTALVESQKKTNVAVSTILWN